MSKQLSWKELSINFETIIPGIGEIGGTDLATQVLEYVIGPQFFEEAVDAYIKSEQGAELARSVLVRLRTNSATLHCYKVYKTAASVAQRSAAVELLAASGTALTITWIPEFLSDSDSGSMIPGLAMRILDQLLYRSIINEDQAKPLYEIASHHSNKEIRELALSFLQSYEDN